MKVSDYREKHSHAVPASCWPLVRDSKTYFATACCFRCLKDRPQLKYILLHNVDTLGASVDAGLLGTHISRGNCLSFEVISRRLEDRGGGLARVNGQVRLAEGLSMPREQDEFKLSFYNSMTTWIDIDQLLTVFGLTRDDLSDQEKSRRRGAAIELTNADLYYDQRC